MCVYNIHLYTHTHVFFPNKPMFGMVFPKYVPLATGSIFHIHILCVKKRRITM